jgi:hypothetical protein
VSGETGDRQRGRRRRVGSATGRSAWGGRCRGWAGNGWHWVGPSTGRPARDGQCRGRAGNEAGSAEAEPATGWAASGQASDGASRHHRAGLATGTAAAALGRTTRGWAAPGIGQTTTPRGSDCDAIVMVGEGGGDGQRRRRRRNGSNDLKFCELRQCMELFDT